MATDATATAAFKLNPITFLANAMILAPMQNALRHNRSEHLGLAATGYQGRMVTTNAVIPVWQVTKAGQNEPYFRSYIADYEQGETTRTTLGANEHAEFCFTANMNGCTFGLGVEAHDGTLIVTHGNAANTPNKTNYDASSIGAPGRWSPGKTAMQTAVQFNLAKEKIGDQGRVFEPEHYRNDNKMAVTFGWRQRGGTGHWSFYYVSYKRALGQYECYGVHPMPTNSLTV